MTESSQVSLTDFLVWPITMLILVLALRRQIGAFLSAVGGRITHVSVLSVQIGLAVATETAPPWRGRQSPVRRFTGRLSGALMALGQ